MKDPLAGRRERINAGEVSSLIWPDVGEGCPVKVGEIHNLRSCRIEITRTERMRKKLEWDFEGDELPAGWYWRAAFTTYWKVTSTPFLARRRGITTDRKRAMATQDGDDPGTLVVFTEDERDPVAALHHAALGPEPELAVDKHEIPNLTGSRLARQQYELDMAERRMREANAPLEERLVRLREMATNRHVDITSDLFVIEQRIEKAEAKVLERSAA